MIYRVIGIVAFLFLAPLVGGLLSGLDRKISARMQGRIGPSILQPFYDVIKLLSKQFIVVNTAQIFLVISFLLTVIFTGCMFFGGSDILLCFFLLSTGATFLIFAACDKALPILHDDINGMHLVGIKKPILVSERTLLCTKAERLAVDEQEAQHNGEQHVDCRLRISRFLCLAKMSRRDHNGMVGHPQAVQQRRDCQEYCQRRHMVVHVRDIGSVQSHKGQNHRQCGSEQEHCDERQKHLITPKGLMELIILFLQDKQICLGNGIRIRRLRYNRLHGNLLEAKVRQMQYILCKCE